MSWLPGAPSQASSDRLPTGSKIATSDGYSAAIAASERRTEKQLAAIAEQLEYIKRRLPAEPGSPNGAGSSTEASPPPGGCSLFANAATNSSAGFASPSKSLPPPNEYIKASRGSFAETPDERLSRIGTLTVHVKSARDLIKADFRGLSDPYCLVHLPAVDIEPRQTAALKQTLNPDWDEKVEFDCELRTLIDAELHLSVFDKDYSFSLFGHKKDKHKDDESRLTHHHSISGKDVRDSRDSTVIADDVIKTNKDDKLGRINPIKLEFLKMADSMDYEDYKLEGVATGTITFSITWVADSSETGASEVQTLVDRDPEIRGMLKKVRMEIEQTHARETGLDEKTGKPGLKRSKTEKLRRNKEAAEAGDMMEKDDSMLPSCNTCVHAMCGPILHPEGRFRTGWNVMLALLILYCGVSVPLEIAFEMDMALAMCGDGLRSTCGNYLAWFWSNFVIDLLFIVDIFVNFRTGCAALLPPLSHPIFSLIPSFTSLTGTYKRATSSPTTSSPPRITSNPHSPSTCSAPSH